MNKPGGAHFTSAHTQHKKIRIPTKEGKKRSNEAKKEQKENAGLAFRKLHRPQQCLILPPFLYRTPVQSILSLIQTIQKLKNSPAPFAPLSLVIFLYNLRKIFDDLMTRERSYRCTHRTQEKQKEITRETGYIQLSLYVYFLLQVSA